MNGNRNSGLRYDVMPSWWWSVLNRHEAYKNYVEEEEKWEEKERQDGEATP
jgi:hypothetical protein